MKKILLRYAITLVMFVVIALMCSATLATATIECTESYKREAAVEPTNIKHAEPAEPEHEPELMYIGEFRCTAYDPCVDCSEEYGRQTSTGATATAGRTIAVDPRVIPYGTIVVINGHEYVAEDCGGLIKGNRIDIFFDTHEEVDEFGVKYLDVYIRNDT